MKSFKSYISEEEQKPTKFGHVANVGVGMEGADFWIHRRGSIDRVGHPTREYNPEHIGIKVTRTDVLDPKLAYYMMMHLANSKAYHGLATGTTDLVNIKAQHIKDMPLNFK